MNSEDRLILVDADDNILGYDDKAACHRGDGKLHRAFSVFIFNSAGEVLMQKRSALKPLWPLYWSNSVCSHPRKGEADMDAAHRRLKEEIAIDAPLQFLFKFQYQARYKDVGSENELCSVYIGRSDQTITANPDEIAEFRYIEPAVLDKEVAARPEEFSPWFKMEWKRIRGEFIGKVRNCLNLD